MKKYLIIILAVCLIFSLSACKDESMIEDGGSLIEDGGPDLIEDVGADYIPDDNAPIINYYEGVVVSPTVMEVEKLTLFTITGLPEGIKYWIELCSEVIVEDYITGEQVFVGLPKPYEYDIGFHYWRCDKEGDVYPDKYEEHLFKVKTPGTYILCAISDDTFKDPSLFFEITATTEKTTDYESFVPDNKYHSTLIYSGDYYYPVYLSLMADGAKYGSGMIGAQEIHKTTGQTFENDIGAIVKYSVDGSIFTFWVYPPDGTIYTESTTKDFDAKYKIETDGTNVFLTYISGTNIFSILPGWNGETITLDETVEPM